MLFPQKAGTRTVLPRSTTAGLNGLLSGALHVRASKSSSRNISFIWTR